MIDNLALLLSHGLMILAAFRLLGRTDLDSEDGPQNRGQSRWGPKRERSPRA